MATITPLGDKLLIKRLEADDVTAGGIVLPDSAKEKPKQGKVVEVGQGRLKKDGTRADFQVKKDDRVLFSSYAGTEVTVDGEDFIIMPEDEVLAILD